jgi:hypothetical protein
MDRTYPAILPQADRSTFNSPILVEPGNKEFIGLPPFVLVPVDDIDRSVQQ